MKKAVLAMLVIVLFAASSFADVSFLTAQSVGVGKWAVLGMYATNHNGVVANADNVQALDLTNLGVRGEYGTGIENLDVLAAYSMDTLPNVASVDDPISSGKQTSGSTLSLGVKYSLGAQTIPFVGTVLDTAVAGGYESGNEGIKTDNGSTSIAMTSMSIGYIVSKKIDNLMPYGAVAYKMLTKDVGKLYGGTKIDAFSGTGLAFNLGCMIGIAENQAVAVEYNTETQAWSEATKSGHKLDDASATNVSGISLGYVYMF